MIKKLFVAALLVPGLAYGANPSADLSVQIVPAGSPAPAVPAQAAAAGFTTQVLNADFTQTTGTWSNTANFMTNCGAAESVPNQPATWHFTAFDWPSRNPLSCLPYTQLVTDSGSQVLKFVQPKNGSEHDQDMGFPHQLGGGSDVTSWLPPEYYSKIVVRMDNAGIWQSPDCCIRGQGVFWSTTTTYGGTAWWDEDFTEFGWAGDANSYKFEGQSQEGNHTGGFVSHCCSDTAFGAIDISSGYHTLETLVTSNETSNMSLCIWWDGSFVGCTGGGLTLGSGYAYKARDRAYYLALNTINNSGRPPPNADLIMYIKSLQIFSCANFATGTCPGTIVDHWPFP